MAWYYGAIKGSRGFVDSYEVFYAKTKPTVASHGHLYAFVTGTFRTKETAMTKVPSRVRRNRMTRLLEEHDRRPKLRQRSRVRKNASSSTTRQSLAKIREELYDAKKYAEEAKRVVASPRSRRHLEDIRADLDRVKKVVDRQTDVIMEIEEGRSGHGL